MTFESFNLAISARPIQDKNASGWIYKCEKAPEDVLIEGEETVPWSPIFLNEFEFRVMSELCLKGEIDTSATEFIKYVQSSHFTVREFIEGLTGTNLVSFENGSLRLLTDNCRCAVLPNGSFIAGEDKSGRLTRWVIKFTEKWRRINN